MSAAIDRAREELQSFVHSEARALVYQIGGNRDGMRCPEGTINLLADRWFCKVTRDDCPIGAELSRHRLEGSLASCNAPEETKQGVRGAIRAGYQGLHHTAGKRVCPGCRKARGYQARYLRHEWELQTLGHLLDLDGPDVLSEARIRLVKTCGSTQALYAAHCASCLRDVVGVAFPELLDELHIIKLAFPE